MQISKTGLIYDPRMMDHKSKRKHPQKPQRVKFIMKMLQEKFYFNHPKVQYISTISRVVTDQNIKLVHPQKYLKHIVGLWPKTSHRTDITVLDTYFNQKTEKCARLAIGGVLQGIDKIMSKEWQNGFACVRPPGHHSGGRHTINGFCIYNNVAIGARYLLQHHHLSRVAIVDWDVHHGDGTQHVFQKQKNIMLISIHRYDRGTFYPATEFGSVKNQGIGPGQGSKLNLPLDYVDEAFKQYKFQSPGDNEYIYLYHRIIEPVLKEFNPDFILVSSGFDAARGDPLGGFSITPNGYYYLTKRLTEFQKPLLIVLEGGYNLQSISLSAQAVMRALVHQQLFPQPIQVSQNQIKYKCYMPEVIHKQIDAIVEQLSKNWPNLKNNQDLQKYTQIVKGNQQMLFGQVEQQESSSSSEQQQDSVSNVSVSSQSSTQSNHKYNTRSKSKANDEQLEMQLQIKQLEKDQKQWEKQMEKMKKKQQKFKEQQTKAIQQKHQLLQKKQQKIVKQNKEQQSEKQQKMIKKKKSSKQKKQVLKKIEEQQQINDGIVINQFYFAAGHLQKFKDFSILNEKVHKITYPEQINFYENQTFEKDFTPKYYGKEEDCVILQNLLYQQQDPVVVDVKLSKQSNNMKLDQQRRLKEKKKQQKSTTQEYGFRISGYTTPDYKEGGLLEKGDDAIKKILKFAVTLQNKQHFCSYLRRLSTALNQSSRRYFGTSILLIKGPKKSQIKWVDFHYWGESHDGPDLQMIKGVNNLLKFIEQLNLAN